MPKENELISTGKIMAALAGIANPVAGVAGAVLLEAISYFSTNQTANLIADIETRLIDLEKTGILEINKLKKDKSFLSFMLTACRIAQHTSRNEKIDRIKNAVINQGIEHFDENSGSSILHLIDQLSEEHFVLLSFIRDHIADLNEVENYDAFYALFKTHNPNVSRDVFGYYIGDLKSRNLVRISEDISDEQGLKSTPHLAIGGASEGELFLISGVALELLRITEPNKAIEATK